MLALQDQLIYITKISRSHSLIRTLSALFLFAVCIGGDIFFTKSILIFASLYFTFVSIIVFIFLKRTQTFEVSYAVIPLIVFTGICFLSLFWSVRLKEAEIIFVNLFTGLLTYILFSNILNEENDIYLFLKFIVVAISLNALMGVWQGTIGGNLFTLYGFAAQGATYHPNYFSGFLAIVYPIAILMLVKENRNVWLLPLFLIFLANFFSSSRGGTLTIFLLSAACLCFLFSKGYKKTGTKILLILFLSILVHLFFVFLRENQTIPLSRLTIRSISSTSMSRLDIWQGTLPIIFDHPLWGAGLRSFEDQFKYFNNPFIFKFHSNAHNLFLHLASEVGTVGLLFFMIFSFYVFSSCIKHYENSESVQFKMAPFFLLMAISGFFFHNLGEYLWEPPLFQVLFYFIASLIFSTQRLLNPTRKEIFFRMTRHYKISISGLLIMFWVYYVGSPLLGSYFLSQAKQFLEKGDERAWSCLSKASLFDASNSEPYRLLSYTLKEAWSNTNNTVLLEKAVNAQKKAIGLSPMQPDSYLDLAKLLEEAKRLDGAKFYYEKAASIHPNTLKYKDELALFLERNGEAEKAIALWEGLRVFLEKYEPKRMNLIKVYISLSAMYKKTGNHALLKKYLDLVVNFPDDVIKNEPYDSPVRKSFTDLKKIGQEELGNITGIEHPRFKID